MTAYFIIFIILSFFSYKESLRKYKFSKSNYYFVGTLLIFFMGFRNGTGCDWDTYQKLFLNLKIQINSSPQLILEQLMSSHRDIAFGLINGLISFLGGSFNLVILTSSILFLIPLLIFCRSLPRPFLGINLAFPYFIVVIGMGFIRQGIAIALLMLAITQLEKSRKYIYLLYITMASLFHKYAFLFFLPGVSILPERNRKNKLAIILISLLFISGLLAIFLVNGEYLSRQMHNYFNYGNYNDSVATGVFYTLLMNSIPSGIYLLNYKKIRASNNSKRIWLIFSFLSLICFPALLVLGSTATYRLALYLIPIQFYVGSHLPDFDFLSLSKKTWTIFLIFISFMTLSTWLLFASHANCWLPYQNILF